MRYYTLRLLCLLFCLCPLVLWAETPSVTAHLRNPIYEEGVLSTTEGGVVVGPQLRIQAMNIRYIRKEGPIPVNAIEAEGKLIVEYGQTLFVGKKLYYDFLASEGVIDEGRSGLVPWIAGGERIQLRADKSVSVTHAHLTTSQREPPEWGLYAENITLAADKDFSAQEVRLKFYNRTLFWIPTLRANLDSIFDSPIRYRFRWGGSQGPRVGFTYQVFNWAGWKTYIRFDYRITRGPGGGFETYYESKDKRTAFHSINYIAKDSAIIKKDEKARYRFEGMYRTVLEGDKTTVLMTYDRISDRDMPGNYYDRDFEFDTAERTQLLVRHQEENWIGNFYTRVRLNSFQTLKQELPSLTLSWRPVELGKSGILFSNWASASYLDFKYSKHIIDPHDYDSVRLQYQPQLYRPFQIKGVTLTPSLGGFAIFYNNSQHHNAQAVGVGIVGLDARTEFFRFYGSCKHTLEPYVSYRYYSDPCSTPHHHYIFDITDGWVRLSKLRFGVVNHLYAKQQEGNVTEVITADLYAYAFPDAKKIKGVIPKVYSTVVWNPNGWLRHSLDVAWDLYRGEMDHFNFRTDYTVSEDFAISAEYRQRDSYSWRKVDQDNFFVDAFHSEERLRHSAVSDRRNTLLFHVFYRFHPNWSAEFISRQGWNRHHEPSYLEYELDIYTTIQSAWHLRLSFQHQEDQTRVALFLTAGLNK